MNKPYFIYVLKCSDNSLYCGYSDNVEKRLAVHNAAKGAKYTKSRLPVELLTFIEFETKSEATKCEWWFKHKLNRSKKLAYIEDDSIKTHFNEYYFNK